VLVALLGWAALSNWHEVAAQVGTSGSRGELVLAAGGPDQLAQLAAQLDHLEPGVRIM
jgi:hypothetical protein